MAGCPLASDTWPHRRWMHRLLPGPHRIKKTGECGDDEAASARGLLCSAECGAYVDGVGGLLPEWQEGGLPTGAQACRTQACTSRQASNGAAACQYAAWPCGNSNNPAGNPSCTATNDATGSTAATRDAAFDTISTASRTAIRAAIRTASSAGIQRSSDTIFFPACASFDQAGL